MKMLFEIYITQSYENQQFFSIWGKDAFHLK